MAITADTWRRISARPEMAQVDPERRERMRMSLFERAAAALPPEQREAARIEWDRETTAPQPTAQQQPAQQQPIAAPRIGGQRATAPADSGFRLPGPGSVPQRASSPRSLADVAAPAQRAQPAQQAAGQQQAASSQSLGKFRLPPLPDPATLARRPGVRPEKPGSEGPDSAWSYSIDRAQQLVGRGVQSAGELIGSDTIASAGRGIVERQEQDIKEGGYRPKYTGSFRETLAEEGIPDAAGWVGEKIAENWATTGASIVGGIAAIATAPFSAPAALAIGAGTVGTGYLMSVGEVAQELEERGVAANPQVEALAGAGVTALDRIGLGRWLPKAKLVELARRLPGMTGGELVEELQKEGAKEAAEAVAKRIRAGAAAVKVGMLRRSGRATLSEAATEAAQEGLIAGAAATQGATYTPRELVDRLLESAIVGGAMGGAVGPFASSGYTPEQERMRALQDASAPPRERLEAARVVARDLRQQSPALANAFMNHSLRAVAGGRQVLPADGGSLYDMLTPQERSAVEAEAAAAGAPSATQNAPQPAADLFGGEPGATPQPAPGGAIAAPEVPERVAPGDVQALDDEIASVAQEIAAAKQNGDLAGEAAAKARGRELLARAERMRRYLEQAAPAAPRSEAIRNPIIDIPEPGAQPQVLGPGAAAAPQDQQVSREAAAQGIDPRRRSEIILPDGSDLLAEWDVVEADSVTAALSEGVSQPRDRSRAASSAQVAEIANRPDFRRLSDTSKTLDYGAPTIAGDNLLVGGNGRYEGVSRAYQQGTAAQYREALEREAERFGLDPEAVRRMRAPVLVRRVPGDTDVRRLAIASNQPAGLQMSDMEQAALDAERMRGLDEVEITETGEIPTTARNIDAIRRALADYPVNEVAGMVTADGGLSQSGVRRLRNAMLYRAYGDTDAMARLIESPDADLRNVGTALVRAAGRLGDVRQGIREGEIPQQFDIAEDLDAAVKTLSRLRNTGMNLDEFLAQSDIFGGEVTESQAILLKTLSENLRSAKAMTQFLLDYAGQVNSIRGAADGLFGATPLPTKQEVLGRARQRIQAASAGPAAQPGLDLGASAKPKPGPAAAAATEPGADGRDRAVPEEDGDRPGAGGTPDRTPARDAGDRDRADQGGREAGEERQEAVAPDEESAAGQATADGEEPETGALEAPPREETVRELQREAFATLVGMPEVQAAAEGDRAAFAETLKAVVEANADWLSGDIEASEQEIAAAKQEMLGKEFADALFGEATQRRKAAQAEADRSSDPYRTALQEALGRADLDEDPVRMSEFERGWQHAVSGKTKSTLAGERLEDALAGYEAARAWLGTESGKAWSGGSRREKLKNTGADLRRWFDGIKAGMKAGESDIRKAWGQIERATNRAELFRTLLPDDITPGLRLYVEHARRSIKTFRAWLEDSESWRGSYSFRRGRPRGKTNLEYLLEGSRYPTSLSEEDRQKFQDDEAYRAAFLRDKANEYLSAVQDFVSALSGATSVAEASRQFAEKYLALEPRPDQTTDNDFLNEAGKSFLRDSKLWEGDTRDFVKMHPVSAWTAALIENEATISLPDKSKPLTPPRLDRVSRDGPSIRKEGEDVTPQRFKERFGFADVGFGKWVGAQQDQDHLNYAHDAFADLARHFGTAEKNIGLGGRLHFTIGALGHGKHAAHFQTAHPHPDGGTVQVINVTNTRGDGTLYHEWGHALDHNLGGEWRTAVRNAVLGYLKFGALTPEKVEEVALRFLRGQVYWSGNKNQDRVKAAVYAMGRRDLFTKAQTAYKSNADKLGKSYWGNNEELIARAIEAWASDTLGHTNTYLVNPDWSGDGKVTPAAGYRGTPYPGGAERELFNQVLTALSKAVKWDQNGLPSVTLEDFTKQLPEELVAGERRRRELLSEKAMAELQRADEEDRAAAAMAKEAERREAEKREQEELDRMAEEALRNVQVDPPAPSEQTGQLTEADLEALWDEAAAELRESIQEQPDTPPPGVQPAKGWTSEDWDTIHRELGKGNAVLLAEEGHGIPTIHEFSRLGKTDMKGFGAFETVGDGWRATWEGGGAMRQTPTGKAYTVVSFDGGSVPKAAYDMQAAFDAALDNKRKASAPPKTSGGKARAAQPQSAKALISEAAKLGVKGVDEALTALSEIFGGPGRLKSFPGGFDEDSYQRAKPHLQAALKSFQEAGRTLKELFQLLIREFGEGFKKYAIRFAQDEGLTSQLGAQPSASSRVADWVARRIERQETITWQALFAEADRQFGGTQAEGRYTPRDAYDALEAGINRYLLGLHGLSPAASREQAVVDVAALQRMLDLIPTQSKRTAEQEEFQQFSTVPPFAYVANWVANINYGETVLEPSAGVGGLAVFARKAGAKLVLNELSSRRAAVLQEVFPAAKVFRENAEQIHNILPDDVLPSAVVMNPPFSSSAARGVKGTEIGARHVEQALARLAPNGRLVAIVGEGMALGKPSFAAWWEKTQGRYDVRAVVPVSGAGYAKYGTTFDNVLLVIDKRKPSGKAPVTTRADNYVDLIPLLAEVRNGRSEHVRVDADEYSQTQRDAAESALAQDAAEREGGGQPGQPGAGVAPAVGAGEDGGRPGVGGGGARSRTPGGVRQPGGGVRRPGDAAGREGAEPESGGRSGAVERGGRGEPGDQSAVTISTEETKAGELTDSVFENYQPRWLRINGAQPHPGPLVESAAMASVPPPKPTYTPNLPKETITEGKLSLPQLEPVVYSGQAHEQMLDLQVSQDEAASIGVPAGTKYRRGFFIGDGTGVGKGREIGGILLDNLRRGRKKHVWISEKQGLIEDAKRDFKDVGGDPDLIFNQNTTKADRRIEAKNGVVFTTYATLRSSSLVKAAGRAAGAKPKTRIDQLIEWLGPDFDGVIAFDEVHNAGNAIAMKGKRGLSKPSAMALAVVELQQRLPNARVVYVSATGATEVSNLSFASRLGLWGMGTAFPSPLEFINEMNAGGLATMELVARDLKQAGSYLARSLSYDEVTYSRLEHELSPLETDIYNRLAEAWQVVLRNIHAALDLTGATEDGATKDRNAKSRAMAAYWGAQQRFFNQIITSMQMPSVLDQVERDIAAGDAVLLQLINTNEAQQEREFDRLARDETADLEDFDLTPRDQLISMVEKAFPIHQIEEYTDENGNTRTRYAKDSEGNLVVNREAVALRDKLLEDLREIRVPDGPLERLLNHFGPDAVAEVTGRKQRVVRKPDENGEIRAQREARGSAAAAADAKAFLDDRKRILVFSDAGGTGFSFHADRTKKNQRKRKHYLIQPGWRANKAVQGLGRSHRTNQASAPHYVLASTNIPAHKRFLSSIARRLDQLGALTRGQRNTSSGALFSEKDNLESKYGAQAVRQLFDDAKAGQIEGVAFLDLLRQTGLEDIVNPNTGEIAEDKYPTVSQFLNRMLSMSLDMQELVFDAFISRMEEKIEWAAQNGVLDTGMQTIRALETRVVQEETIHVDERTGAETRYVELELTQPTRFYDFPGDADKPGKIEWVVNVRSGRVWGKVRSGTETLKSGAIVDRFRLIGTGGIQIKQATEFQNPDGSDNGHYRIISEDEARALWESENAKRPTTYTDRAHMIVGAMLPIWDRIKAGDGAMQVVRVQTVDGQRMLGRLVPKNEIADLRRRLNLSSPDAKLPPAQVLARILKGDKAELANGWILERARVSGELRIELKGRGLHGAQARELVELGAIQERINWQERFFIPTGSPDVLAAILKNKPLVELRSQRAEGALETPLASMRAGEAGGGMSAQAVSDAIAARIGRQALSRLDDALVIPGSAEALRSDMERRGSAFSGAAFVADAQGFYDPSTDTSYVLPWNISSPDAAYRVFLHEVGVHYGLERMLGQKAYAGLVTDLQLAARLGGKQIGQALRDVNDTEGLGLNPSDPQFRARMADLIANDQRIAQEVLGYIAENHTQLSLAQRILGAIRAFLRRLGVRGTLDEATLISLARTASRRGKIAGAALDGGERQVVVASRGGDAQPRRADITETEAFQSWFGSSVVTDNGKPMKEGGRPLWVYHGTTAEFEAFDSAQLGRSTRHPTSRLGFWFSSSPEVAELFTQEFEANTFPPTARQRENANLLPVYLRLENPYRMSLEKFREIQAQPFGAEFEEEQPAAAQRARDWIDGNRALLEKRGYDGILIEGDTAYAGSIADKEYSATAYVVFRPEQIKSVFNRGVFDPNNADILASGQPVSPWYYSALARVVDDAKQARATADQWMALLRKSAVKAGEIEWLGVEDWLRSQPGKTIAKEDFARFIAENQLQVLDVVARDDAVAPREVEEDISLDLTDYEPYTLRGGENYREFLLTLPPPSWWYPGRADAPSKEALRKAFFSPHFEEPNILVHLRTKDWTDTAGRELLLVEEVQSDWHQAGRKKGYRPKSGRLDAEATRRFFGIEAEVWRSLSEDERQAHIEDANSDQPHIRAALKQAVPAAPMAQSREWGLLGMKRALRFAAENGYDMLAWTPGNLQAERYSGQGGEGLRAFYDEILPAAMNKYLKQWGVKVGETTIISKGVEKKLHAVDIIPEMFASVLRGQPLFSRRRAAAGAPEVLHYGTATGEGMPPRALGLALAEEIKAAQQAGYAVQVVGDFDALPDAVKQGIGGAAEAAVIQDGDTLYVVSGAFSRPADARMVLSGLPRVAAESGSDGVLDRLSGFATAVRKRPAGPLRKAFEKAIKENRLAFVTRRQLVDLGARYLPEMRQYLRQAQQMDADRNALLAESGALADRWLKWARNRKNRKANEALVDLMHDSTIAGVDPSEAYVPIIEEEYARQQIADLKEQARRRRGENTGPILARIDEIEQMLTQERARAKAAPGLQERWAALPEDAKALYREVRDAYERQDRKWQDALLARVADEIQDGRRRAAVIDMLRTKLESQRVQKPYFPLFRVGDYWAAVRDAEGDMVDFRMFESEVDWNNHVKAMQAEGFDVAHGKNIKQLLEMDGVAPGFVAEVEQLVDDPVLQDEIWQRYLQTLPDVSVRKHFIHRRKVPGYDMDALRAFSTQMFHGGYQLARMRWAHKMRKSLERMEEDIGTAADDAKVAGLERAIVAGDRAERELGAEYDALQADIRLGRNAAATRKDLADLASSDPGWRAEFLRRRDVLDDQIKDGVRAEKRLAELRDAIAAGKDAARRFRNVEAIRTNRAYAADLLSELKLRHQWAMNPKGGALASYATAFGFGWFLGVSPAAALVNITQVPLVTLPVLGAKYGYGSASKELTRAYRDYMRGGAGVREGFFSIRKSLTGDEAKAYDEMVASGVLDKTLAHDLAGIADQGIAQGTVAHRVMSTLSWSFHKAELANREITAIAAYRLARQLGASHEKAVEAADDMVWDTQFDYTSGNRARVMQSDTARVLLLFRQFAQNMTYLLARTAWMAFSRRGGVYTAEERAEARKTIAGILGMTGIAAGATGLPIYPVVAWAVAAALDDEDEPIDPDTEIRNWLASVVGEDAAELLAKGAVNKAAGIDLSSRVSLANLWWHEDYREREGRSAGEALVVQAAGPVFSAMIDILYTGPRLWEQDQRVRALEKMSPKFVRDVVRAGRFQEVGVTTLRGDPLLDDLSPAEIAGQMAGFTPARLAERYEQNSALKKLEQRILDRRRDLLDAYALADRLNDTERREELIDSISRFNQANPEVGITADTIRRSLRSRAQASAESVHGVRLSPRLRARLVESVGVE